jgi:hypothetical protein
MTDHPATRGDALLDALAADLTAVRRPSPTRDFALLAGLAVTECVLYLVLRGGMRPDMGDAMGRMAFWWKVASLLVLAVIGVATTLATLSPERSPRRGLRTFAATAAVAVTLGWILDAAHGGGSDLIARLNWRVGIDCLGAVVMLSVPPLVALVVALRRGAPTDTRGVATAAGVAAAAWGGAVFTFACPSDDPFYVVVWFSAAIAIVAAAARLIVPRLTRW